MDIKKKTSIGVVGYDIDSVSLNEMRQMHELKERINNVLNSHKPEAKEKKYVNDDDLKFMYAILSVFTKEYTNDSNSAFDDFLKEEEEAKNKPQSSNPVDDKE